MAIPPATSPKLEPVKAAYIANARVRAPRIFKNNFNPLLITSVIYHRLYILRFSTVILVSIAVALFFHFDFLDLIE